MNEETYLGDGLYVRFDGFSFILRAPRARGNHYVAMEPSVLLEFEQFVKRTKEQSRLTDNEERKV